MEDHFEIHMTEDQLRGLSSIALANAQVHTVPHHASRAQYGTATALEALFGWLYLSGRRQRVSELFDVMMEE